MFPLDTRSRFPLEWGNNWGKMGDKGRLGSEKALNGTGSLRLISVSSRIQSMTRVASASPRSFGMLVRGRFLSRRGGWGRASFYTQRTGGKGSSSDSISKKLGSIRIRGVSTCSSCSTRPKHRSILRTASQYRHIYSSWRGSRRRSSSSVLEKSSRCGIQTGTRTMSEGPKKISISGW